ncbi:MAG: HpcH/HpaI aldolase family protein [Armatimonadota bacterium]
MKTAQILREKINADRLTLGMIATFHVWPGIIETAMKAGLDYLIIDLEHVTWPADMVAHCCAQARMLDFPVLIRPPQAEMVPVRLAMDAGPCGLMIPYVQGVETMQTVQDACYMPPRGKRRPGGFGNFWVPDYNYETWVREVEDDFIILAQIENKVGLSNAEAIAAHPLTTAIAIGPYDLSADLGVCWQPDSPVLLDAVARIREAGRKAGKNMWHIGDGPTLVKQGFTFVCIGEPLMLMMKAMTDAVKDVRNNVAVAGDTKTPLP